MEEVRVYEVPNGMEDKTRGGRAEAESKYYWETVWRSLIISLGGFKRWEVGGRVQVCWCIGQALLLPNPGPLPSMPPEPADTASLQQHHTIPFPFICSKLISAPSSKVRHCTPLELSTVKLHYGPCNVGFLLKLVIWTFKHAYYFLNMYLKSESDKLLCKCKMWL